MKRYYLLSPSAALLFLFLNSVAWADDSAHDWLMRIGEAARKLSYDGTFIYQHDSHLEALRIVHKVENGKIRERMVSLTGEAREIVRTDNEVQCYLPDQKSVTVEHRNVDSTAFPSILPERLQDLDENYVIEAGQGGRVTGRPAQDVIIHPRDEYRYGYQLWADRETGLLLRADLLGADGHPLERFMFTHIKIGGSIPAAALRPESSGQGLIWYRNPVTEVPETDTNWIATKLPPGFRLSAQLTHTTPDGKVPVEHLIYTDGLATVSVFVQKEDEQGKPIMQGPNHMGAVHAFGSEVDEYQVTAVGEVPAATVALIGSSMARKQ